MACTASLGPPRNADMASVSRSSRPWARWKSCACGKVSTFPTASSQPPARCSVASSVRNCQPCPGPTLASIASRSRSTCCRTSAPPSAPACTRRNVLPSAASRSLRAPARGGRGQRRPPSGRGARSGRAPTRAPGRTPPARRGRRRAAAAGPAAPAAGPPATGAAPSRATPRGAPSRRGCPADRRSLRLRPRVDPESGSAENCISAPEWKAGGLASLRPLPRPFPHGIPQDTRPALTLLRGEVTAAAAGTEQNFVVRKPPRRGPGRPRRSTTKMSAGVEDLLGVRGRTRDPLSRPSGPSGPSGPGNAPPPARAGRRRRRGLTPRRSPGPPGCRG